LLRDVCFDEEYRTGETNPLTSFFLPALTHGTSYWLAAGYFSSRLFDVLGTVLGDFVRRGGKMCLVTSVHLTQQDKDAIEQGLREAERVLADRLKETIEREFRAPLPPGTQLVASMLKTRTLEIKLATRLGGGLYHEKLGVIIDERNDYVAFTGSANATQEALQSNFESIDVYTSWRDPSRAEKKRRYLKRLWKREIDGVKLYDLPDGLKHIVLREYEKTLCEAPKDSSASPPDGVGLEPDEASALSDRYLYQQQAVQWFCDPQRANGCGILWMATGTGKTITALKIASALFGQNLIDAVVINTKERLLIQWDQEMKKELPGQPGKKAAPWRVMTKWHTADKKQASEFRQLPQRGKCLLITYSFLPAFVKEAIHHRTNLERTLLIVDEAHNTGADENIDRMNLDAADRAKLSEEELVASMPTVPLDDANLYLRFGFRLALSATPLNEYDDVRNEFILRSFVKDPKAIDKIPHQETWSLEENREEQRRILIERDCAFYYGLDDGIKNNILVPFEYKALLYEPTEEEKTERIRVMRLWQAKVSHGEASAAAPYIHMAKVFKSSQSKITVFKQYMQQISEQERKRLLGRALLFVDTKEFGSKIAEILHTHDIKYHTFFDGDEEVNLKRFSVGSLDALITCHMISEGVDIRSVSSILLFASDRQRLETIQRIGRALRKNPQDSAKKALILDFVYLRESSQNSADAERMNWLQELSAISPQVSGI